MALAVPQLRALVAVVDAGGFGAAAVRLGISQSAVSHAIAALERDAGRPVLTRETPPTPTALGRELLQHARIATAALAAAEEATRRVDAGPAGSVTLAAPPSACHGLLPGLLVRWRAEVPKVRVVLFEGEDDEVARWLADGTADLAVLVDPEVRTQQARVLAEDRFCAVLRTDHPLAAEDAVGIAELTDDPLLLSSGGCERQVRELYRRARTPFAPAHQVRQLSTLFAMVRAGIGISVVPGLVAGMQGAELVLVPVVPAATRSLVLTGPRHRPWHPAAAVMIEAAAGAGRHRTAAGPS